MMTTSVIQNRRLLKRTRALTLLIIAVALIVPFRAPSAVHATNTTESTIVLQTTGAPLLQSTSQVINNGPANQTNPHVDCNLVSYTNDDFQGQSTVRYKNLVTGSDNLVPGNDVDLLSDISGSHVAYTEVDFPGDRLMVFDTSSQTRTVVPGLGRSNPSIGGNLVAFEDRGADRHEPQIAVYDLTTGIVTPLTDDSLRNLRPIISPTGNAVVWEKCQTTGLACSLYSAVQTSPGVFTTRALTEEDGGPHWISTDGVNAVYTSSRTGESDVYYQNLVDGSEVHLAIPGNQRATSISGNLITFSSESQNGFDVFLYDMRSESLFQVTNTIEDENLPEINICNGVARIVYVSPGDGAFDAYAVSFPAPTVVEDQLGDLIALIKGFNLPHGTENSLVTKLQQALTAIEAGNQPQACSVLADFTNECAAQSGKKLTAEQATQLINAANLIKTNIGCQ